MLIGQISELSGYSQRMIRYLEDQGLIEPDRSDSNLRRFKDQDLTRILKIKRLKELGFSYADIKELIDQNDSLLASRGRELLKRHHAEASELNERIRQLETICFGRAQTNPFPQKMSTYLHPIRTAYRIERLGRVWDEISKKHPNLKPDVSLWKFGELSHDPQFLELGEVEAFEIFKGSSVMAISEGPGFLPTVLEAFQNQHLHLGAQSLGTFQVQDLSEFFARSEIVIDYQILDANQTRVFQAILPYQAIFIASGETLK